MKTTKPDPILEDIQRAVKDGYFDEWQPSELLATPVEELLSRVGSTWSRSATRGEQQNHLACSGCRLTTR